MDRRKFLMTSGTIIAGATLTSGLSASGRPLESASFGQGRIILPINRNWRHSSSTSSAAHLRAFDEFVGYTYLTKTIDNIERLREHTVRHARVHDQLASNSQYAGGIAWCAFDYNTHYNFGSGDHICYHGVADIFREPKPAAGLYRSQCDPDEEIVLAPAVHWARGDENVGFTKALVCSNCHHLKFYIDGKLMAETDPDRQQFSHLKYAPFSADLCGIHLGWGDLPIDGYIEGKLVISRSYSGKGVDQNFVVVPDDTRLIADGADPTRVVLRVTDEFDAIPPFASDANPSIH